jgi:hypothetical protein
VTTSRMFPRGSHALKICPRPAWNDTVATTQGVVALAVATAPAAMASHTVASATSATPVTAGLSTSSSCSPSIGAQHAGDASSPTCPTWPYLSPVTRSGSNGPPCDLPSRTDSRIGRPVGICGGTTASLSPGLRSRIGSRRLEKKSLAGIDTEYLDRVLETFSGYLAIDELYDGPFCVISVVDNRMYQRLAYRVLEKSPTKRDVRRFLREFAARLASRGCRVRGITTDGSSLYPQALAKVFPSVPHQVCEFHVLKEITRAILHTLARVRKQWQAEIPKQPRGRPSRSGAKAARRARRMQQRSTDLFANRHLFVRRHLRPSQKGTLRQVTRGLPQLRTLREIMDEVYRLFDRRCRTETALERLDKLQRRVRRFQRLGKALAPLFTPNLEKALTFLDDKLLPATSNAVERSNRRYRKAQRSIYSVRTAPHIRQRIALDMQRSERTRAREQATQTLRNARDGGGKEHR